MAKELVTVLRLDSKKFTKDLSQTEKNVLAVSAAAAGAATAVAFAAKATADFQDATIKASRAAGLSVEKYSEFAYQAELSAVSTEELVMATGKLSAGTPAVVKGLESLGIAAKDSGGNLRNTDALIGDLADKVKSLKNPADQSAAAIRVFGESGGKLVSFLSAGSAGLREMADEARDFGRVVTEEAGLSAEKFNDDIARVGMALEGVRDTVMTSVIAWVNQTGILESISDVIKTGIRWWNSLDKSVKDTIISIGALAIGIGIAAGAYVIATKAIAATTAMLSPQILVIGAVIAATAAMAIAISNNFEEISEAGSGVSQTFQRLEDDAQSLSQQIQDQFAIISESTNDLLITLGEFSDASKVGALEFLGVANATDKASTSVGFLAGTWEGLVTQFDNFFPKIRDARGQFAIFAKEAIKSTGATEKFSVQIQYLRDIFDRVKKAISDFLTPTEEVTEALEDAATATEEITGEISILGTVAKATFFGIATFVDSVITGYRSLITAGKAVAESFISINAAWQAFAGRDFEAAGRLATQSLEDIKQGVADVSAEIDGFKSRTMEAFGDGLVVRVKPEGIKETRNEVQSLRRELKDVTNQKPDKTYFDEFKDNFNKGKKEWKDSIDVIGPAFEENAAMGTSAISGLVGKVAEFAKSIVDIVGKIQENVVEVARRQTERQLENIELYSRAYSKLAQEQLDAVKESENARIESLKQSEKIQLDQLRQQETAKLAILGQSQNEKLLLQDAGYQAEKEKAELEFQEYLLAERARFEADLIQLDEFNLTIEERRATEAQMEANWLAYKQFREKDHLGKIKDLSDSYLKNRRNTETKFRTDIQIATEESNALIEEAEAASNAKIEKEQKDSDAHLAKLQEEKEEREKNHKKYMSFVAWVGESSALEATKGVQAASAIVAGVSGAAQAFASLAWIPFVGPFLGAAAAAAILAATSRSVSLIHSQRIPPPPELFFDEGGAIRESAFGGPSAGDVVPARLRPGEGVLDLDRARSIERFVDAGLDEDSGTGAIVVKIEAGAIVLTGLTGIDESTIEELARLLAVRIQREMRSI